MERETGRACPVHPCRLVILPTFPRLLSLPARLHMCTGPTALIERRLEGTKPKSPLWNKNCWTKLTFLLLLSLVFSFPFSSGACASLSLLQEPRLFFDVSSYFLKGSKDRKMRIIIFSWHFLGMYSVLWDLVTGAFPSSVQIGELERLAVLRMDHWQPAQPAVTDQMLRTGTISLLGINKEDTNI